MANQNTAAFNEYNQKAREIMNEVAGKQPEEVKKRVKAVQQTVEKATDAAKEAVN
ncbi:MAG: hypothetical protein AAF383_17400 [Cyanobacteria bacterium P01_A01_bin.83]